MLVNIMKKIDIHLDIAHSEQYVPQFDIVNFHPGWGRRPPHGHVYGKKYIDNFIAGIEEAMNIGFCDKSK
eukprot:14763734-Ditylum_brightwellii.AAC.1